ncbi:MAG: hypothetical protein KDC81_02835 [Flavobacteriaceae bacterium]|nr:hypothetical protein [Flavobacteriaceae bacterium]
MNKTFLLIFILIGLQSCRTQNVNGIWMSYNNRIINNNYWYASEDEGVILDFDNQTIGTIQHDSIVSINIDFNKSKLSMKTDTLSVNFKVYKKDSIEIDFGRNMMHVFRPLNLDHKLSVNKSQINNFLFKNNFGKINDTIDVEFSDRYFFRDIEFEKTNKKNALINKSWNDEGYWYVKEIEQNFFLIFTLSQTSDQNIYQITSIDDCKLKFIQLQETEFRISKLIELNACD